eukprot:TRINITY_DN605_c0_g1_i1.p1 TRINITY_DN605_c0_g1~~TRINITY_DN605_c0_g1_i1.p1  ORF type:complete len:523 (-),score=100.29 TRINITY_DN605_c0_g1_i1:379-1947(-)
MSQSISALPLPSCTSVSKFPAPNSRDSKLKFDESGKIRLQIPLCRRQLSISCTSDTLDKDGSLRSTRLNVNFQVKASYSMATQTKRSFNPIGGVTTPEDVSDTMPPTTIPTVKEYEPKTAEGGGGGDIGKKLRHGGGDGGGDGGDDDDDYFGDFDEEDGGDEGFFRRRMVNYEIFDRKIVEAVLQEWYKTITDLPAGLLQACEMGLVSSAQMVRYLSINARPTFARTVSRALPESVSREFLGRMIADPGFLHKLVLEQATTIGFTTWWEIYNRQDRIKQEWHLALLNVLTASTCNAVIVWSLAPCRSYGSTFKSDLQNTIQKLPNNVFEKSYPLREFDLQKRVKSFFYKAAELCLVGMTAGAVNGGLAKLLTLNERTSIIVPSVKTSALSYGAFLGLSGNLRYQLILGMERLLHDHLDVIGLVVLSSTVLRVLNMKVGDINRIAWLGLDVDPVFGSGNLLRTHRRQTQDTQRSPSSWYLTAKDILSNLFTGNQEKAGRTTEAKSSSKAPKRRRVKRKIITAS